MSKRSMILTVILSFFVSMHFISCGLSNTNLDYRTKDKVDFISVENGKHYIEYEGDIYWPNTENLISIDELENDVFLGWNGTWWGYKNKYYSCKANNPIYIYEKRINCLYISSEYDFSTDGFILEGTNVCITPYKEFIFQNDFIIGDEMDEVVEVTLYSQKYPELKIYLHIFQNHGIWYASTKSGKIYCISEHFIAILSGNQII